MPKSMFDTLHCRDIQLRLSTLVVDLESDMPLIQGATAPTFSLPNAAFTGLASPSRGSKETSVWRVVLAPESTGAPHSLTREEIFVAITGRAVAEIDGERIEVTEGDALVVPANR